MAGDVAQPAFLWDGVKLNDLGALGGTNQIVVQGIDSNTGGARVFLLTQNFSQPSFNLQGILRASRQPARTERSEGRTGHPRPARREFPVQEVGDRGSAAQSALRGGAVLPRARRRHSSMPVLSFAASKRGARTCGQSSPRG